MYVTVYKICISLFWEPLKRTQDVCPVKFQDCHGQNHFMLDDHPHIRGFPAMWDRQSQHDDCFNTQMLTWILGMPMDAPFLGNLHIIPEYPFVLLFFGEYHDQNRNHVAFFWRMVSCCMESLVGMADVDHVQT